MRVRFAPSPTGHLHVGNARTALFNWLMARSSGGTFILRIEDTDTERSTRESEEAILDDLRWLGLEWDEGPDHGGPHGPYRQSERLRLYKSYASELIEGGRAYHCFCSAERLEAERQAALAAGQPPQYSGACRHVAPADARARVDAGEPAVVRFKVPADREVAYEDLVRGRVVFQTSVIGDPVLVRSDGMPAYNFAVVIDDALMEVTDVVRGEDHISNTPRQLLIYEALGFAAPRFAHLSLVMGPDHAPLSKRHGATSVAEFRAKGYLPEALVNYLALIGWSPGGDDELLPVDELARRFSIEAVGHSAGVFDEEKLAWVDRHYLRMADPARVTRLALAFFRKDGFVSDPRGAALEYLTAVVPMGSGSVDRLDEIPARLAFLFRFDPAQALARPEVAEVLAHDGARAVIESLARELSGAQRLIDRERFRAVVAAVKQQTGQKAKGLFHPIRVALTGEAGGPELDVAVPAIDRGAELPIDCGLAPILGCRERAAAFAAALS
ncbi:MAG TPA: glutamate--tRNA ligase [Vicinamibacterales bacterium]|jgi:glutamyl-tRNA synthetase/nondiscriminating glutamyl-tRNA synthetase